MKGRRSLFWPTFICVLIIGSTVWVAHGQATFATIRGRVTDAVGAVVPGVSVTVTNQATNVRRTVVSGDEGNYEVTHLNPGTYRVSAELPGFKRFMHENIVLRALQTVRIDVRLEVGELATEVTVEAGTPVVESETPTIAQSRDSQQIRDLPTHIRGTGSLYQWTWLTPTGTQGGGSRRSYGGGRAGSVYFNVDGISANSPAFANQIALLNPAQEAMQEIRFQYVNAKAEFGENGGVTAITKSGSNAFHGSAYFTNINSALSARNFFASTRDPIDPQTGEEITTNKNQVGGSLGGPIIEDKLFFFFSLEYLRDTFPVIRNANIPTLKMREGDFSELLERSDPIQIQDPLTGEPFPGNILPPDRINFGAFNWQERFYSPIIPNAGAPDSFNQNFRGSYTRLLQIPQVVGRVDFQTSENNSLYGRYQFQQNPQDQPAGQLTPEVGGIQAGRGRGTHIVVSDTWTLSPTLINEFKAGYGRRSSFGHNLLLEGQVLIDELGVQGVVPNPGHPTIPDVRITGFSRPTAGRNDYVEETYHVGDSLTWIKGRHSFKMGVEWLPQLYTSRQEPTFGRYDFANTFTGFSYADFLLGLPRRTFREGLRDSIYMRYYWINAYFQDDFKIAPNFTLNWGLRYDWNSPQADKYDVFNSFDPETGSILIPSEALRPKVHHSITDAGIPVLTAAQAGYPERSFLDGDKNNVAPRIGFAWRPFDARTVIRGGYGIFYDQFTSGITANQIFSGPFEVEEQFTNRIVNGQPLLTLQDPFLDVGTTGSISTRFTKRDIVNPYLQQWNLTIEQDLGWETALRFSYIGTKNTNITFRRDINQIPASTQPFSAGRRPYPLYNELRLTDNGGNSSYNALSVDFERKGSTGLYYQLNWTWAKNIGDVDDAGNIERGTIIENSFCRHCERGNFEYTPRHRLIGNLIWELPFGQGRRFMNQSGVAGHVLGGWQITSVVHAQTGRWLTPSFSGSDPSNTNTIGGRPDRIADGNLPSGQRSINRWFDASAFVEPPDNAGRFGNAGRGIVEGPGRFVLDLGLHKRFTITEESWVRVQISATNVLNRANFDAPNTNISSPGAVGRVNSIWDSSDFAGPREVMLGVRFEF